MDLKAEQRRREATDTFRLYGILRESGLDEPKTTALVHHFGLATRGAFSMAEGAMALAAAGFPPEAVVAICDGLASANDFALADMAARAA